MNRNKNIASLFGFLLLFLQLSCRECLTSERSRTFIGGGSLREIVTSLLRHQALKKWNGGLDLKLESSPHYVCERLNQRFFDEQAPWKVEKWASVQKPIRGCLLIRRECLSRHFLASKNLVFFFLINFDFCDSDFNGSSQFLFMDISTQFLAQNNVAKEKWNIL